MIMTFDTFNKYYASPNSHAFLNVSRSHLVTQVHHKLGKLFDIDDVFWILRVCIDDLCASVGKENSQLIITLPLCANGGQGI